MSGRSPRPRGLKRWAGLAGAVLLAPGLLLIRPGWSWLLAGVPLVLLLQAWAEDWGPFRLRLLPLTPLNLPLLLLVGMLLASLWASPDLATSLPKIAGLLLGILLFFTSLRYTQTRAAWNAALLAFCAAGTGAALLGLVGTRWFTIKLTGLNELTGQLPQWVQGLPGAEAGIHPNILAGTLLWVLPAAGFAALAWLRNPGWFLPPSATHRPGWISALALGGASLLMGGVLLLAQSRSAYLAAGLAGTWLVLALFPARRRAPVAALVVLALVGVLLWVGLPGLEGLLAGLLDSELVGEGALSTVTFAQRLEIWSRAQWAIRDAPVSGLGMDIFRLALPMLYPLLSYNPAAPITHAHNEILQAALDLGLPGLAAFLALNLGAFAMLVRLLREDGGVRLLALGLSGGLLAHFLFGLTDAAALGGRPGVLFWLLLGLIASLYRLVVTQPALARRAPDDWRAPEGKQL